MNNPQSRSTQNRQRSSNSRKGGNSPVVMGDPRSSASISLRFPYSMTASLANAGDQNGSAYGSMSSALNIGATALPAGAGVMLGTGSSFQLIPFASVGTNDSNQGSGGANVTDAGGSASWGYNGGKASSCSSPQQPAGDRPPLLHSDVMLPVVPENPAAGSGQVWPPTVNSGGSTIVEVYGEKVSKSSRGGVVRHEITFRMMHSILGHG